MDKLINTFNQAITKRVETRFGLFICTNATRNGCYKIERDQVTFYDCPIYRAIYLHKVGSELTLAYRSAYSTGRIYFQDTNQKLYSI